MQNTPLPKPLRTQLENTVKTAREIAEQAASAALAQLAVGEGRAPDYLSESQRALRRRLRAHGRALGDLKAQNETQGVRHLVWEVAYQHWHRMLFARFLAESGLLLWEPGAPVSLDDCREMVDNHPDLALGARSQWELAGRLAARMLPQVFKPRSPVFELSFAPEHQRELERLLGHLPVEVFWASDSLGWVYQFWQAKRKDEVNASEVKIGADELPAVTQLFTEPYMVDFLLHNSLGAWWVTRYPDRPCPVPLNFLRTLPSSASQAGEGGGAGEMSPAAGRFEGWPERLADFRLLDPCCGSGHFLVAAFLMLVPMRMVAEELSAAEAVDAVLRDNLHGLELDARCVEIAVFALALAAWRYPDANGDPLGVRAEMPAPRIACCGLKVAARPEDWEALVPEDAPHSAHLREGLRRLHETFQQAPLLGSLLDPGREHKGDLFAPDYEILKDLLQRALRTEQQYSLWDETDSIWDYALSAQGLLEAAQLLEARYDLVITNVPYLARGKQSEALKAYCERHYPEAKNDLANVFLERCLELSGDAGRGVVQIVMPQNWLFLTSYRKQRERLLKRVSWNLLGRLGEGGFDSPQAAGAFVILLTQTHAPAAEGFELRGVDASEPQSTEGKADLLRGIAALVSLSQKEQLANPDSRIVLAERTIEPMLSEYATAYLGLGTGDFEKFGRSFWEIIGHQGDNWSFLQCSPLAAGFFEGLSNIVAWDFETMRVRGMDSLHRDRIHNQDQSGQQAWNRAGVSIALMRDLKASLFQGTRFDKSLAVIVPNKAEHLPAIWAFCESPVLNEEVRKIEQKVIVTNATLVKVPFDLAHWQQVAAERYPNGLPKPYSDDPTQWLFHGHPQPATDPLQVAVARLLGYRWPAETDPDMELADEARAWIARCEALTQHSDADGIVCLPSVRGEKPAHERLLDLLIAAWETVQPGSWKPSVLDSLLADAAGPGKSLETWLRDSFFEQHARRFHHRPFIWHVWDGLKDGFGALVNYHRLDAKHLERLIHTYLGDWIRQQEAGVRDGRDGAETRLAAAQHLKRRLELILEGEAPYDIFVRWKPLAEQPIGWNPDLNDGVRLNIRPFMTAEVLRHNKKPKLNIHWNKDRGKDVESAPWFPVFQGERINDHHLTLAEKLAARGSAS